MWGQDPVSSAAINGHANMRDPKSMVIRIGAGEVGSEYQSIGLGCTAGDGAGNREPAEGEESESTSGLHHHVRPLGVTHLLLFSRSTSGNTNLRLAVAPEVRLFISRSKSTL